MFGARGQVLLLVPGDVGALSRRGGELGYTTLEDITARKNLELANQHLYDTQETILQLVAHDLKAPVHNIEMIMDMLRRHAGAPHQPGALPDKRLAVFRLSAQDKGIRLRLELPTAPIHANIQADKFGRILDNLLSNALSFTLAGGTIRVRWHQLKGRVRLGVRDTELGIPEARQPHVFDEFTAAARPGLYGDTTTSLSLFITKQIVEVRQGKIWLESKEDGGTTFFIDLRQGGKQA